jgi:putative sugar O-methyltransferase
MEFKHLKEFLYHNYYNDNSTSQGFSDVTSSHWREFGKRTTVIRRSNDFEINAYGISDFSKKTLLRKLYNIPASYFLVKILKKYNANEATIKAAKDITEKLNILFNFDHVKHILIFDLLKSHDVFNTEKLICILGDGHGFFGTLIKTMMPNAKILFVNLGRNLLIDSVCFSRVFPDINPLLLSDIEGHKAISKHSIIFLEAEKYKILENLPVGLFVNIASMQEMDVHMIKTYFEIMKTSTVESYFYCCNREEKILPDGSIIRFNDYPWSGDILIDEPCPWYQKYPSSIPPFWRSFDGVHLHRLIKINKQ